MELETRGKSELYGKEFRLEGVMFGAHPLDKRSKIQVSIFSIMPDETAHVICTSTIQKRRVRHHRDQLEARLGVVFDEDEAEINIIPFVARDLRGDDLTLDKVRPILEDGWPGANWSWWDGSTT